MENASKALIIAGAILLAILLISLGIMVFSQAQDTVSNSGMSDAAKTTFNSRLLKYEGTKKGSEIKALINEINVINADESSPEIKFGENSIKATYEINSSSNYEVKLTNGTEGIITTVTITEK